VDSGQPLAALVSRLHIPLYQGGVEWPGLGGSRRRQRNWNAQLQVRQKTIKAWNNRKSAQET